jgi:hypothetical protein
VFERVFWDWDGAGKRGKRTLVIWRGGMDAIQGHDYNGRDSTLEF